MNEPFEVYGGTEGERRMWFKQIPYGLEVEVADETRKPHGLYRLFVRWHPHDTFCQRLDEAVRAVESRTYAERCTNGHRIDDPGPPSVMRIRETGNVLPLQVLESLLTELRADGDGK